jgi:hypothetical protein
MRTHSERGNSAKLGLRERLVEIHCQDSPQFLAYVGTRHPHAAVPIVRALDDVR